MARTSTKFQMKNGMLEAIHNYLTGQGYNLRELNGCPTWVKGDFWGCYYCVQFCDMGDKFILDEWLEMSQTTEEFPVTEFTLGAGLSMFTCMKKHQALICYIKSF